MNDVATPVGLADGLKASTSDLHVQAERHPFQGALVRGLATRADYGRWLSQMHVVHASLEPALVEAGLTITRPHHFRLGSIDQDLSEIGEPLSPAVPAAAEFAAALRHAKPATLIGALYVLEGATNGGVFIARAVRGSMGVGADGTRYLDPHGAEQRARWAEFRTSLATVPAAEHAAVIAGARETFSAICRILDGLSAA